MPAMEIARAFVDAINRHNVDELARLMTEDHVFTDSLGGVTRGRDSMKAGWASYFELVPDYTITIEETFSDGPVVILLGAAGGNYAGKPWSTPAAWRAKVRGDQVAEWRVYADNEPIRELMRKAR
jgi:ketosteroid isomerase-like protein